jgi:hypothetical protein
MADERKLVISLDASGAIKTVKDLTDEMAGLNTQTDKIADSSEKASKNIDDVGKSSKAGTSSIGSLAGGMVKALGIVALISKAFELFSGALMKNQKVADTVNTVMGTIEIVLSEVVGVIVDVVTKVGEATGGFDALGKVVTGLITIAFTPLKAAFFGIKLALLQVQLAWEESFFGDDDPETIKDLNKRISETKDNLIEVGEDAIKAGEKVVDNIVPALQSIGQVVEGVIDGVSKIDVKAAAAQAKTLTQLENSAILAEAQAARLAAQYENQAEIQRQIRDDESNSIQDRKKANDELAIILEKQENAQLQQANAGVELAQANLKVNNTIENQAALTNALAAKDQILADIQAKRSEQKVNEVALNKELIELDNTRLKSSSELSIKQQKFDASLISDKVKRLEVEKGILKQEKKIELERLQNNINLYKEGTQERVDAEIEFATKKQEINNKIAKNEKDIADEKKIREDKNKKEELQKEKDIQDAKFEIAQIGLGALSDLVTLFTGKSEKAQKRGFEIQKGISIATATISGIEGVINALTAKSTIPEPFATAFRIANSVAIAASTAVNIAKIKAQKFDSKSPPTPDTPTPPSTRTDSGGGFTPPTFNLSGQPIGGAGTLLGSGFGQNNQQSIKVFVSETDISNVQNKVKLTEGNSLFEGPQ